MIIKKLKSIWFVLVFCIVAYFSYQFIKRPDLTVIGVVNMSDGIGRQSVEVIDALRDKFDISFLHTLRPCYKGVSKKIKKILKAKNRRMGKVVLFEDSVWTPESENYKFLGDMKNPNQIRFAYSMFESSRIPEEWVNILDAYFDAVVVPDDYHVDIYKASGVKIPIFTLPLGLNLKGFMQRPLKIKPHAPFVFGNLSAIISRKNTIKLVKAFHKAFPEDPSVKLIVNGRYFDNHIKARIENYISKNKIKNIEFTQNCLNTKDYLELFESIDCYVSPSRGEGFSIQPREAMALGIPVIVSNNTAQKTICDSGLAYKISTEFTRPALRKWGKILEVPVQYGFEYDFKEERLVEALKNVYENYDSYLASSEKLRNWVKKYDYSEVCPLYKSLVKPDKIILSDSNGISINCLTTNDKELFEKYKKVLKTPS